MDNSQRATVAFLCGCLSNQSGRQFNGVFDYSQGNYIACNYVNSSGSISVFDYQRGCYLSGRFPSFFDYGVSQYLSFTKLNNNSFSVFDYNTGNYITANCNGHSINIYDYSISQFFYYQVN